MGKGPAALQRLIGLAAPLACLVVFGSGSFLLPSMGCILILLLALRKPIEKAEGTEAEKKRRGGGRMTAVQMGLTIAVCTAATMITRFLPCGVLFQGSTAAGGGAVSGQGAARSHFGMLIVYCLKSVTPLRAAAAFRRPSPCW